MTAVEPPKPKAPPAAFADPSVDTAGAGGRVSDGVGVRSAARGSALNLVGAVTAAVVSFVTVGFVTNNYGQAGAGLFFTATAIFTLAANSARLGGESGLTFFVARFRASGENGAIKPLVTTAATATLVAATGLAAVGFAVAPALSAALTADAANTGDMTTMIRILAVAVPALALSQVLFGATRGYGTMRPSVTFGQIVRPVAQLALVLAAIALSTEVWLVAGAWAGASVATAALATGWVWRRLARSSHRSSPFQPGPYWRFAGPRAITDLVSSALERSDILLVAYFLSEADVGLYGASSRLILAGQLMMYATAQSMAPLLSASFLQRRHADAAELLRTITAWNVLLLWPLLIGLAFGAETVLGLFGDGFADGAAVVRVLAVSLAVIVALGAGDTLLLMTGDSVGSLVNHLIALTALVGASVLLLPRVGLIGAAVAWGLSRFVLRGLAVTRVWQTTRVHAFGRGLVVAVVSATVSFVSTGLLAYGLIDDGALALLVHLCAGGLLHVAFVVRFRDVLAVDQLLAVVSRRPGTAVQAGVEA